MTYPINLGSNKWVVQVQKADGMLSDFMISLPDEALSQVGWEEGDVIEWFDNGNGSFTLTKKEDKIED